METIEQTVKFKDWYYKIRGERVFARAFGTTIYNYNMHWNWIEISDTELAKTIINNKS